MLLLVSLPVARVFPSGLNATDHALPKPVVQPAAARSHRQMLWLATARVFPSGLKDSEEVARPVAGMGSRVLTRLKSGGPVRLADADGEAPPDAVGLGEEPEETNGMVTAAATTAQAAANTGSRCRPIQPAAPPRGGRSSGDSPSPSGYGVVGRPCWTARPAAAWAGVVAGVEPGIGCGAGGESITPGADAKAARSGTSRARVPALGRERSRPRAGWRQAPRRDPAGDRPVRCWLQPDGRPVWYRRWAGDRRAGRPGARGQ